MNYLIDRKDFPVIQKKPKQLRHNQVELYELILEKTKFGGKITINELIPIFKKSAFTRHNLRYPAYINNGRAMTQQEISQYLFDWFFRNIGCLVKKGYLKIIPVIDFENVVNI